MEYYKTFNLLFLDAKRADEFEYACALLDIKGVQSVGWDPWQESVFMYRDISGLLEAPLDAHTKVRLALLLYCHLTEINGLYKMIYNMLRIIEGKRCSVFPFEPLSTKLKNGDRIQPTTRNIVSEIIRYSTEVGRPEIGSALSSSINHDLRNAFYHSDYTLYDNEFRSTGSWFVHSNGIKSNHLSANELNSIVNSGISLFEGVMNAYSKHRGSYKKNKIVMGRFTQDDSYIRITLLANKNGLYGFEGTSI